MYLAPLNYDRFFKKVFSHTHIAKAFLEDFLGVEIEEITLLERTHLLTNSAMKIEVDFRCKIAGSYIIIDMQQWYKPDVVKRFYLYHCAATALQLEDLPIKRLMAALEDARAKNSDYQYVEPVLTLVWMVDDSLEFTDNYVAYTNAPESALNFINNQELWESNDLADLQEKRKIVLQNLGNKHKDLLFLQQNRLIFMFQHNIVKDEKLTKYKKWFSFAEKTKNKENDAEDFQDYVEEEIFKDIMKVILKNALDANDLKYLESEDEVIQQVNRYVEGLWKQARREMQEIYQDEIKEDAREFVKEELRGEVKEELRGEVKEELRGEVKEELRGEVLIEGIQKALKRGKLSHEEIAEDFEISLEFVLNVKADMEK